MTLGDDTISATELWNELKSAGVRLTNQYTNNGRARLCKKRDGELFSVSVHEVYPAFVVDKILEEQGFYHIALYNNSSNE